MEKDAISAGSGSLISSDEIKILICYIMDSVNSPVPGKELANLFNIESVANYFEVIDAMNALEKSGSIVYNSQNDTYTVTAEGARAAKTLKNSLPFSIREKAFVLTSRLISRKQNAQETSIEVFKDNGRMYIRCSAMENGSAIMSFKLMVADEVQAKCIKERFLDDPSKVYSGIIDLLTSNKDDV